jgi:hypothetical protein
MNTKLKLRHIRVKDKDGNILSKGGATISGLVDENNKVVKHAVAWCHQRDNFNRHTGKVKATNRMYSENHAVSGDKGWDWHELVQHYSEEVTLLQLDARKREMDKLNAKANALHRRIEALRRL